MLGARPSLSAITRLPIRSILAEARPSRSFVPMRKIMLLAGCAFAMSLPTRSIAAQRTGVIAGTVVDPTGRPLAEAEVIASAENARARTDSAGHFEIRNLEPGQYNVRVRRVGYEPGRSTADLSHGGKVDVRFELKARPALLDSVFIIADGNCPDRSYVGFICRRKTGKGVYFTDDDLFDRNAREIGDIFRGVAGFRIEMRPSPWGQLPTPISTRASLCLNAIVNGMPSASTNPIPRYADELVAVEIYASPSDVPAEYQRFAWGRQGRQTQSYSDRGGTGDRCSLVVYWTGLR